MDHDTKEKLIFNNQETEQINDLQIKLKEYVDDSEIDKLYDMLKYEVREIEAF